MTDGATKEMVRCAECRNISYSRHAQQRMEERGIQQDDVRNAVMHHTRTAWQSEEDAWAFWGPDEDGETIKVVACMRDRLHIITTM